MICSAAHVLLENQLMVACLAVKKLYLKLLVFDRPVLWAYNEKSELALPDFCYICVVGNIRTPKLVVFNQISIAAFKRWHCTVVEFNREGVTKLFQKD